MACGVGQSGNQTIKAVGVKDCEGLRLVASGSSLKKLMTEVQDHMQHGPSFDMAAHGPPGSDTPVPVFHVRDYANAKIGTDRPGRSEKLKLVCTK